MDESNADENVFLISVIMPVYNTAEYLRNSVDNILSASIHGLELILVNDGSDDGSGDICRSYSEMYPCVKVCEQANLGPSAARNNGLRHAAGEYIVFFDSDDYIDGKLFYSALSQLKECGADMMATDFHRVADNGCILDRVYQIRPGEAIYGREYLTEFLSGKDCVWNVWRYIFRREFIEKNGLHFSEGCNIAEDLEFVVRALSASKTPAFFHEPYYNYRVNYGDTLTRRFSAERVRQFVNMLSSASENCGSGREAELIKRKLAREYILNLSSLYEVPREERGAALRELKRGKNLMDGASGVYAPVSMLIKLAGIRLPAAMLLAMKRIKRFTRGVKTKRFGEER